MLDHKHRRTQSSNTDSRAQTHASKVGGTTQVLATTAAPADPLVHTIELVRSTIGSATTWQASEAAIHIELRVPEKLLLLPKLVDLATCVQREGGIHIVLAVRGNDSNAIQTVHAWLGAYREVLTVTDPATTAATSVAPVQPPHDPVERAVFDWNRKNADGSWAVHGHPDQIVHYLDGNASAPLYLGKLALLVRSEDPASFTRLQQARAGIWQQAMNASGSVMAAEADYALAAKAGPYENQTISTDLHRGHMDDAVYQAEIVRQLAADRKLDSYVEWATQTVAGVGTTSQRDTTIGATLANAEAAGGISVADVVERTGAGWRDQPMPSRAIATPIRGAVQLDAEAAAASIEHATQAFQAARDHVTQLDMRCAAEIKDIQPALSRDEVQQYVRHYHDAGEYPNAVAAESMAAKALQAAMSRYGQITEDLVHAGRGGASGEQLLDQYIVLAASDVAGAQQAERWASQKCQFDRDGYVTQISDPPYRAFTVKFDQLYVNVQSTTLRTVVSRVMASLQAGTTSSLEERFDRAWRTFDDAYLTPFDNSRYVWGAKDLKAMWHELVDLDKLIDANGKPRTAEIVKEMGEIKKAAKTLDPLSKRIGSAVIDVFTMFSEVQNGSVGNIDAVMMNAGETVEKLKNLLAIVRTKGTNQAAEKLATLRRLNNELSGTGLALTKVLPIIDAVTSAYAAFTDLQKLDATSGKDPFAYAQFLGDAFSTLGGVLELAPPPLDVVGKMMNIAGQAVSSAAGLLDHFFTGDENPIAKQKLDILTAIHDKQGATVAARDAVLAKDEAAANLAAAAEGGMSREQIQALISRAPVLFEHKDALVGLRAIQNYLEGGFIANVRDRKRTVLKKRSFEQFVDATIADFGNNLRAVFDNLRWSDASAATLSSGMIHNTVIARYFGGPQVGAGIFPASQFTVQEVT